jgi:cyclic pyranopterin phosphate synthase
MPEEGIDSIGHSNLLSLEQIFRAITLAARIGIRKVRFTGGEPLVRNNITQLIASVATIPQIDDISLTTNGIAFADMAQDLKQAGLNRVNFSLDSLVSDKFTYITRWGKINAVTEAISTALRLDMGPVKINTVIIRGFNDNEILDFVQLACDLPIHVRFIEFMPIGDLPFFQEKRLMSVAEMQEIIASRFALRPIYSSCGGGPAKCCQIVGGQGTVGFISAMSSHFCFDCNRIRMTPDGKLRSCLFGKQEIDLKLALDNGASDEKVLDLFKKAILNKPNRHHMDEGWGSDNERKMVQIGG